MKSKFGKFLMSLLCIGGILGLTACQSASHTATVPTEQCEVRIYQQAGQTKKTGVVTLGINNNTIYNIKGVRLYYDVYKSDMTPMFTDEQADVDIIVRHGVQGYLSYTIEVDPLYDEAAYAKITKTEIINYASLWETYTVPFVLMFIVVGFALVFFGIEIFGRGLTKEDVKDLFKERLGSTAFIFGLILLICMIPLMFSSWVVTLILVGGVVGTILLTGVMTLIRMATLKD